MISGPAPPLPTVTTAPINRSYANSLLVLVSHLLPHGGGTIHTEQIPHTSQVKPIDYIGLYIIVTAASMASVNWLFRIYFS